MPCERIGQQFALGKIHKDGVELDFENIAMRFNHWLGKINDQCRKCFRVDSCVQCIFNINDLDSKQPICHGFMGAKEFAYYVANNMSFLEKHPEDYQRIMNEVTIA